VIFIDKQIVRRYLHRIFEGCGGEGPAPLKARQNLYNPYKPPEKLNRPCGQNFNYGGWSVVLRACDPEAAHGRRSDWKEQMGPGLYFDDAFAEFKFVKPPASSIC
jgi:hypothetical protein